MKDSFTTKRLTLNKLDINDHSFILELVNTPGWIKYIGDRNIKTEDDAKAYIQKIIHKPGFTYWTVKLNETNASIGIVTFLKREHLEHPDIGFAFLPDFEKMGYAYEATKAVLNEITYTLRYSKIIAITLKENANSIKLLKRLGLSFEKTIEEDNKQLLVYSLQTSADKQAIDQLARSFFNLFTNTKQYDFNLEHIYNICLPETIIIRKGTNQQDVFSLDTFIVPRKKILLDGTLTEFEEYEIYEETKVINNIAQRFSMYQKNGYLNGQYFEGSGSKMFQFVKTINGWKIASIIWEDKE